MQQTDIWAVLTALRAGPGTYGGAQHVLSAVHPPSSHNSEHNRGAWTCSTRQTLLWHMCLMLKLHQPGVHTILTAPTAAGHHVCQ